MDKHEIGVTPIGMTHTMRSGRNCTIIGWRSARDIDVLVQTEHSCAILLNRRYADFIAGTIEATN